MKTLGTNARRLLRIARVLAAHTFAYLVARYLARWPWLVRRVALARLTGPQRFRRLFEDLGGSFIKFGQMLALQPDIVSREYGDELFNLLDRIAPFPYAHVEQVFSEDLGRKSMIVIAAKMDVAQDPTRVESLRQLAAARGLPYFEISSATGLGIDGLKYAMAERVLVEKPE